MDLYYTVQCIVEGERRQQLVVTVSSSTSQGQARGYRTCHVLKHHYLWYQEPLLLLFTLPVGGRLLEPEQPAGAAGGLFQRPHQSSQTRFGWCLIVPRHSHSQACSLRSWTMNIKYMVPCWCSWPRTPNWRITECLASPLLPRRRCRPKYAAWKTIFGHPAQS